MKKESKFLKKIQSSKIKQPTQMGFSIKVWKEEFSKIGNPTEDDKRIYEAGLWFNNRLNLIRSKYKEFPEPTLDVNKLIQIYVGIVNREYNVTNANMKKIMEHSPKKTIWAGKIPKLSDDSNFSDEMFNPYKVESIVTAIKHVVSDAIRNRNISHPESKPLTDTDVVGRALIRLNIAIHYEEISQLWSECLWNGWRIKLETDSVLFLPTFSPEYISKVIGEYRRVSLMSEMTHRFSWMWNEFSDEERKACIPSKIIVDIKRINKKKKLILGSCSDTTSPPTTEHMRIQAEELYWNDILTEALPLFENTSIRELLLIWDHLSYLGSLLEEKLPNDSGIDTPNKTNLFAPKLKKRELVDALVKATGLAPKKILTAFTALTFVPDMQNDTWFKPFIPLGDENYTFIIPALTVPNLIRTIENWLKEGGINLSKRGNVFEGFVRAELLSSLKESAYLNKSYLHPSSMFIKGEKKESEEIDLLLLIGSSLFIGEIKCSISPATPVEWFNYNNVIHNAVKQVKRKAKFIELNIHKVLEKMNFELIRKEGEIKVYPLVITNLPFGVGVPIDDVPIVDLYILQNYIKGHQKFFTFVNRDGELGSLYDFIYHKTELEAESNLFNYLKNPPLYSLLKKDIQEQLIPVPMFSNDTKNIFILMHNVIPPDLPSLKELSEYAPEPITINL